MKTCTKCLAEKPLGMFSAGKTGRHGLRPNCKACRAAINPEKAKARTAAWYAANTERARVRSAAYYTANTVKVKARAAAYRAANPARVKASNAVYQAANTVKVKAVRATWRKANQVKIKARSAAYRTLNPGKVKAQSAAYRAANPEKTRAYNAAWRAANPENLRIRNHNQRARKNQAGGSLSLGLAAKLFILQKGRCACCGLPLGKDYHRDHVVPLARGGPNTDDNIQLLRATCNMQKGSTNPVEFMQRRGFLL